MDWRSYAGQGRVCISARAHHSVLVAKDLGDESGQRHALVKLDVALLVSFALALVQEVDVLDDEAEERDDPTVRAVLGSVSLTNRLHQGASVHAKVVDGVHKLLCTVWRQSACSERGGGKGKT